MNNPKGSAEPSMEDILASIRRILSEDEAEEQAKAQAPEPEPEPPPPPPPPPEPEPMAMAMDEMVEEEEEEPLLLTMAEPEPEPMAEEEEDVLELTDDMLMEEPAVRPVFDLDDMNAIAMELEDEPTPPQPARRAAPLPYDEAPLMSEPNQEHGANSLQRLVKAVARDRAILLGQGGLTIEELVRELLRPVLKDWLDDNLPYMIERIVKQEIEKLVNRVDTFD